MDNSVCEVACDSTARACEALITHPLKHNPKGQPRRRHFFHAQRRSAYILTSFEGGPLSARTSELFFQFAKFMIHQESTGVKYLPNESESFNALSTIFAMR